MGGSGFLEVSRSVEYSPQNQLPMYAVIRHYKFKAEDSEKISRLIQEGFLPLLKKANGFISYHWLDTGAGEGASLSVFQDKAGADESIRLAAEFVKADMVKDGAVVIDVGITRVEDATRKSGFKLKGDVDFENVSPKTSWITPVPGGVGPMTIAALMKNTYRSCEMKN